MRPTALCLALSAACLLPAQAPKRPFELADLDRQVGLGDPQISPDGKGIAFLISRVDKKENRDVATLAFIETSGGEPRTLVTGRRGLAHPRWSPDGRTLAFLAEHEGKEQIFLLPMGGGEAQPLTHSPTGVQHFSWSPDGARIAFAAEDEAPKLPEERKGEDGFEVGNDDLFTGSVPQPVHIWMVDSAGGEARRLTSGSWTLPVSLPPSPPASPLAWSPDGKSLAFTKQATPHTGDQEKAAVELLDLASGSIKPLTGQSLLEGFPSYSPDGKQVAYWWAREGDYVNQNEVYLAPAAGGAGRSLTGALDRCLYRHIWMPDGQSLLVAGNDGTHVAMWVQPLQGAARRLDLGDISPSWSFWVNVTLARSGALAFTGRTPHHGTELYVMDSASGKPRRLTHVNDFEDGLALGRVERVTWKGPEGQELDGVLTHPVDETPGKHPLALVIHGGPNAASVEGFSGFNQLLAAKGFLVFEPNYRGSDNHGNAFYRAIANNAGEGPGQDVMTGVESLKAKGLVDEKRMVVSGWSYGGYMTSWLLGRYPEAWKAGMAGAAVTDLEDEYALSDGNQGWHYYMLGALPYDGGAGAAAYRAQSPISLAQRIQAPTMIMTMNQDSRVPPVQSYKLYRALKDRNAEVRFYAWPQGGHGAGTPARRRQVTRLWVDWLAEHAGLEQSASK